MEFYAINFFTTEAKVSVELYQRIWGGKVLVAHPNHGVWEFPFGTKVSFDKASTRCPSQPGTVTLVFSNRRYAQDQINVCLQNGFQKDFPLVDKTDSEKDASANYLSLLDPWGNRIWFYWKE